jgi:hypothetical protein
MNNTTSPTVSFTSNMLYCKTEFSVSEETINHAIDCMAKEPDFDFMVEVLETPFNAGRSFPCLYRVSQTQPDPELSAEWFLTGTLPSGEKIYLLQR